MTPAIDPSFRDAGLPVTERVERLLGQMTLEEKAGLFFHTMIQAGPGGALGGPNSDMGIPGTEAYVLERHMNHFNLFGAATSAREIAVWHNRLQELAASTRLGIPVTVSTDPRHAFGDNPGAAMMAGPFSRWPEALGLAAIGSEAVVERFADIARQEYLAVGIRVALHPQVDLATEPRWARQSGTFGEDADLTGRLGAAYVRGFQGSTLGAASVAAMAKHFPGGGPQLDGEDPHFDYGREQVYPGGQFELHVRPFLAVIEAGVSQMMPYYGMPVGTEYEEVGFAFNRGVVTGILREQLGFDGIVCTDWGLITDTEIRGFPFPARAWGVEHLSGPERMTKLLDAGVDQFGGEAIPEMLVELVRSGAVSVERIDVSARRLLREKFLLGLFDAPLVDVNAAEGIVGRADFRAAGADAQRASITVLDSGHGAAALPLASQLRVVVDGLEAEPFARYAVVVDTPEEADVAVVRLAAPYEPREGGLQAFFHAGSLEYSPQVLHRLRQLAAKVPVVLDVTLERPAIVTPLLEIASALVANYGADSSALADVLFGAASPCGRLPFDLPRSTDVVAASRSDVPFDTADPVFRHGHGVHL